MKLKENMKDFFEVLKKIHLKPKTTFWVVIIIMAFIYNYNHIIFERPVGIHQWRNCVSAGYALGHYHGADFFHPQIGGIITENHTSDVVVLECPLLYYPVGLLYKIFGYQEFLYRLFNVLLGFIGLFSLFKISKYLLNDTVIALSIPIFLFTSTVFTFYINNYIPDATALAFALMAFYQFYKYYLHKKDKYLIFSIILFTIAGLLKVQSLLIYFGLLGVLLLEMVFNQRFGYNNERLFKKPLKHLAIFLAALFVIFAWYYYAKQYSINHGAMSSIRLSSAIWFLEKHEIFDIMDLFRRRFNAGYFHNPIFIYFTFLVFVYNLIRIKRFNKLLNIVTILVFVQFLLFNVFFFFSIGRCDYYQINNLAFIILVFLNLFLHLKENYSRFFQSKYFKTAIIIIGVLLIADCQKGMKRKYSDIFYQDTKKMVHKCGQIEPYLRHLGIERQDRVYYTPDPSMNISLYLMNQMGNTDYLSGKTRRDKIEYLKEKGLKYIMIGEEKVLEQDTTISKYVTPDKKIGEFNGVHIFRVEQNVVDKE